MQSYCNLLAHLIECFLPIVTIIIGLFIIYMLKQSTILILLYMCILLELFVLLKLALNKIIYVISMILYYIFVFFKICVICLGSSIAKSSSTFFENLKM